MTYVCENIGKSCLLPSTIFYISRSNFKLGERSLPFSKWTVISEGVKKVHYALVLFERKISVPNDRPVPIFFSHQILHNLFISLNNRFKHVTLCTKYLFCLVFELCNQLFPEILLFLNFVVKDLTLFLAFFISVQQILKCFHINI